MSWEDGRDLPAPDWNRYAVRSRANYTGPPQRAVGSPLRWGGRSELVATVPANSIRVFETQQFMRVQAADTYARSWSLCGTLRASSALFTVFANSDPLIGPGWWASLVVTQGAGQATVTQRIDLRALTTLTNAAGYRTIYDGDVNAGGATVGGFEERPFRLVGSLLGNALSFRVHHLIVTDALNPVPATPLVVFAEVAPLAASEGL